MSDFVIAIILIIALVIVFSANCLPEDLFSLGGEYPSLKKSSETGPIIPGSGEKMAEANIKIEAVEEKIRESSEDATEVANEIKSDIESDSESDADSEVNADIKSDADSEIITNIKTEDNYMIDNMISFWHGVAAVLIGEATILIVASVCVKIRLAYLKSLLENNKQETA